MEPRNKYQEKSCIDETVDDELQLMVLGWVWIQPGLSGESNPELMQTLQPHHHALVKRHAMCCLGQRVKLSLVM